MRFLISFYILSVVTTGEAMANSGFDALRGKFFFEYDFSILFISVMIGVFTLLFSVMGRANKVLKEIQGEAYGTITIIKIAVSISLVPVSAYLFRNMPGFEALHFFFLLSVFPLMAVARGCRMIYWSSKYAEYSGRLIFFGFLLILLTVVVTLPLWNAVYSYRKMKFNQMPYSDIKEAYMAAQAYFNDYPNAVIDKSHLLQRGSVKLYEGVELTVLSGKKNKLTIIASHINGSKIFEVNYLGQIISWEKNSTQEKPEYGK